MVSVWIPSPKEHGPAPPASVVRCNGATGPSLSLIAAGSMAISLAGAPVRSGPAPAPLGMYSRDGPVPSHFPNRTVFFLLFSFSPFRSLIFILFLFLSRREFVLWRPIATERNRKRSAPRGGGGGGGGRGERKEPTFPVFHPGSKVRGKPSSPNISLLRRVRKWFTHPWPSCRFPIESSRVESS